MFKMKSLFVTLMILIISATVKVNCQTSRKKMIEEMSQGMKDMENTFSRLTAQLKSTEANINLFQDKLNVMLNAVELTKVRTRMIEEKFLTVENKLSSIEEAVKVNVANLLNGSVQGSRSDATEKGLLKIMNVLTDLYGLVKENHSKDKSRLLSEPSGHHQTEANMRKIVREEVDILKHTLASEMNITGFTGRLGEVFSVLVNLQENSCKQREDEDSFKSASTSTNAMSDAAKNEMCSDFSRLRNQVSFAVQELRTNMSLVMETINRGSSIAARCPSLILPLSGTPSTTSVPVTSHGQFTVNQADSPRGEGIVARTYDCPSIDPRITLSAKECSHARPSFPSDCSEIIKSNSTCPSKLYAVRAGSPLRVQRVFCDMADNGGGWTVIMRRGKFGEKRHQVDFRTNWQSYKRGFGDINDEFWIGNDIINHLTTKEPQILQIDMRSYSGDCITVRFKKFAVQSEANQYRLIIDEPFGPNQDIAETFLMLNNSAFITMDMMKDSKAYLCLDSLTGGWWVDPMKCPLVYLTGLFKDSDVRREVDSGIRWMTFKENESLKQVQMKIRPFSFLNQV